MYMIFKKITVTVIALTMLAGCSTRAKYITATPVDPVKYEGLTCSQIHTEMLNIHKEIRRVSRLQDGESIKDTVMFWTSMLIFAPAIVFLIGKDREEALKELKGEFEALKSVSVDNRCNTYATLHEIEIQEDAEKEKRKIQDENKNAYNIQNN